MGGKEDKDERPKGRQGGGWVGGCCSQGEGERCDGAKVLEGWMGLRKGIFWGQGVEKYGFDIGKGRVGGRTGMMARGIPCFSLGIGG